MEVPLPDEPPRRFYLRAMPVLAIFWTAQFVTLTVQRSLSEVGDDPKLLVPRAGASLTGLLISLGVARVLRIFSRRGPSVRLLGGVGAALLAALIHAGANFAIFQLYVPEMNIRAASVASYALALISWFWAYAAVAALLLAIDYGSALRDRERRLAALERLAHGAQMRALRYQLNPHFMFNTLNSIAALISKRDSDTAETMVESLSDFLRASLAINPQEDIPLAREVELQALYLGIEKLRFGDRLDVSVDVPAELAEALVPSLLLQPLAENAIRHAVAQSNTTVHVRIAATVEWGRLRLSVSNSPPDQPKPACKGTSVGLANVEERLRARFGGDCALSAGATADGGFEVSAVMPLLRAAA